MVDESLTLPKERNVFRHGAVDESPVSLCRPLGHDELERVEVDDEDLGPVRGLVPAGLEAEVDHAEAVAAPLRDEAGQAAHAHGLLARLLRSEPEREIASSSSTWLVRC